MRNWILLSSFLFFLNATSIQAQSVESTLRCEKVLDKTVIDISSILIVPGSIQVDPNVSYSFSGDSTTIEVVAVGSDSSRICFRIFPKSLVSKKQHRSTELIDSTYTEQVDRYKLFEKKVEKQKLFDTGSELYTGGRISRGITFGNTNDLSVQSLLNLSLNGKLTDDLSISAVITDQNIPFQPEGNTAQLQELDNVFINLYNDDFSLQAGDLILNHQSSRFLRYYRSVQGASLSVNHDFGTTAGALSFAKGKFATVAIPPIDGVNGPYRIPGPNGENFVVVWANSERVYLDGRLLQRGFNHDYVIDYNLGEVTFNTNIVITQFSRIRIDYEYSDNSYSRTIVQAGHSFSSDNLNLSVNLYSEGDNKNKSVEPMSDAEKELLSNLGDDLDSAAVSGVDSVGFSTDEIRYRKVQRTDINGNVIVAYEYSTNPDSALYKVQFSWVGENNGHYDPGVSTANGKVFEWKEPINGGLTGSYEPFRVLIAPNKKQMVSLSGDFKVAEHDKVYFETAISKSDKNTFSSLDNENNDGGAFLLGYQMENRNIGIKDYGLYTDINMEYLSTNFSAIDRIRNIEFDRDWSYQPTENDSSARDLVLNASVGLKKDAGNGFEYGISRREKEFYVSGFQHRLNINKDIWKFDISSSNFYLDSKNELDTLQSNWIRSYNEVRLKLPFLTPGYGFDIDQNTVGNQDSIRQSQMYFSQHRWFIENPDSSTRKFRITYAIRQDFTPTEGSMNPYLNSNTFQVQYEKRGEKGSIKTIFTHRDVKDVSESSDVNAWTTISGRLDWSQFFFNKIIKNDVTYTLSNSRDLKREFVYIEVPTGQGDYTWRDLNNDGIKDLNEFFLAVNPDERNYAKIWLPTNEYVDAFDNTMNYRLQIRFPGSWKGESPVKSFLYRISNVSSWTSSTKTTDESTSDRLLGFLVPLNDERLLSARRNIRTNFFFNRNDPKVGGNLGYKNTSFKNLLSGGQDLFSLRDLELTVRYQILKQYIFKVSLISGVENSLSDLLTERNFVINNRRIRPSISWQPAKDFRVALRYNHENKVESTSAEKGSFSQFNQLESEVRFNKSQKSYISGSISYTGVTFRGEENSPLGIALLNGKNPGDNYDWNIVWQQNLIHGLQLQLGYNGRKNQGSSTVHMGRVQLSALF